MTPTTHARIGKTYPATDSGLAAVVARDYAKQLFDPRKFGLDDGKRGEALSFVMDYFTNAGSRSGWGTPSLTEATQYDLVRLSSNYWLMITLYVNHWLAKKIIDVPAKDMVRAWPRLTSEIEPKDLSRIDRVIRETCTKQQMLDTLTWARLFGGAGALIVIDGQENVLDEPLDLDSIDIGAYKGLIPFDRWSGILPDSEICADIKRPRDFNLPEFYRVQSPDGGTSFRVHSSRILRFIGQSVPYPEYQARMYWGTSVIETIFEELRKRDNMSFNILNMTFRACILGVKDEALAQMLSGATVNQGALVKFQQRMSAFNQLLSNQSLVITGKDSEMSSTQFVFSGTAEVYQQFQLEVSGAANIPVSRLYGRTLTGIGQSNDADEKIYEDTIAQMQDNDVRPQLDRLYPVICMSTLGEVPKDLDLNFPSIRVLDDKEKADLATSTSTAVSTYFSAGIFTKPLALREIKQNSDITGIGTNITDEDIEAAEKEQEEVEKAIADLGMPPGSPMPKPEAEGKNEKETTADALDSLEDAAFRESEHPQADQATDGWNNFLDVTFAGLPCTIAAALDGLNVGGKQPNSDGRAPAPASRS